MLCLSVQEIPDINKKSGKVETQRICSRITKETGVKIEISSSKNMELSFLVMGKVANVVEAKRRIVASFQTRVNYLFNCICCLFSFFFFLSINSSTRIIYFVFNGLSELLISSIGII